MRERPILFSAPMIRAILGGYKTQTRRIVKPQPTHFNPAGVPRRAVPDGGSSDLIACPHGKAGDRLWVRETWHTVDGESAFYRADYKHDPEGDKAHGITWRPSIFMPRWASRITLEITGVRVERLQDISEADALAEGVKPSVGGMWSGADGQAGTTPKAAYALLWQSINGPDSWAANPFVWVVEFKREEQR